MGRSRASLARDITDVNWLMSQCGAYESGVDENDQTDPASGAFLQSVLFFWVMFKD